MASAASEAAVAALRGDARAHTREANDAATAAWLCAIPCAVLAAVAILVLGPPLGRLLTPDHNPYTFLAGAVPISHPEPTENARYLLAICAPLLGALAVAATPRWIGRVPAHWIAPTVVGTQLALAGLVVAAIVNQHHTPFGDLYANGLVVERTTRYFTPATLLVAALLAAATAGALRTESLRARAAALVLAETRARRLALAGLAVAATAVWMLHAVHSDAEIGNAVEDLLYHLAFPLDETFAVLNGRTPLVDFNAQYGSLWPYVIALPMLAFGKTLLAFTLAACTITGLALLAIYGVFRRASGSALAALVLFLPFLATSLFLVEGSLQNRETVGTFYGTFPLRYAGPLLLAWLTARRLEHDRGGLTGAWLLFTAAGLVLLNNADFGLAALGGTLAALLWATPGGLARPALLRLAAAVAAGLATAFALVSLLTLVRAGTLPQPVRLVEYARQYAVGGYNLIRIPSVLGVNLLVYLTYVAAIVVATVRALRGARNRVLTGMLAWAGLFGLGAGIYYVGRSHPDSLRHELSAWALALALLTIAAVRELAAPHLRRTAIGALIALFGFGVAACSLAQTPTPWGQLQRLQAAFVPTDREPDPNPLVPPGDAATRRFVASLADGRSHFVLKRGAPVAILLTTGHRIADAYGVVNVSPYTGVASIATVQQVETVLDALRNAGGNTVILPDQLDPSILPVLRRHGFALVTQRGLQTMRPGRRALPPDLRVWPGGSGILKLVDTRHLHPAALR
jgi:hypothetical protein